MTGGAGDVTVAAQLLVEEERTPEVYEGRVLRGCEADRHGAPLSQFGSQLGIERRRGERRVRWRLRVACHQRQEREAGQSFPHRIGTVIENCSVKVRIGRKGDVEPENGFTVAVGRPVPLTSRQTQCTSTEGATKLTPKEWVHSFQ